jgi:hypothetical protein
LQQGPEFHGIVRGHPLEQRDRRWVARRSLQGALYSVTGTPCWSQL